MVKPSGARCPPLPARFSTVCGGRESGVCVAPGCTFDSQTGGHEERGTLSYNTLGGKWVYLLCSSSWPGGRQLVQTELAEL